MENENSPNHSHLSHEELTKFSENELLAMLFEGKTPQDRRNRQAAYGLNRRQESRAAKIQLIFMSLATLAAVASAIAAVISVTQHI